ncbi:MAG: hypothetical protein CMI52_02820 [Parcubacteria group bacterium]|nr:hypothetical protein [Parcubacteria group bacterium]
MSENSVIVGDGIAVTRAQLKRAVATYKNRPGGLPDFWQKALDLMGPEPERVKKARSAPKRRRSRNPQEKDFCPDYLEAHKAEIGLSSKDRRRERRAAKKQRHRSDG